MLCDIILNARLRWSDEELFRDVVQIAAARVNEFDGQGLLYTIYHLLYVYIYIYIYIERERERCVYIYIYIYVHYIYIYTYYAFILYTCCSN